MRLPAYSLPVLLSLAVLAACNEETDKSAAAADASAAPAAASQTETSAAPTATGGGQVAAAAGVMMKVTRRAPCRGLGPDAGEEPWDMAEGAFVKFVANEPGGGARVEEAPGMECVIAADALAPA